jgi:adenosylmethionine-8-amino-7-oxononanoate aminotransferase
MAPSAITDLEQDDKVAAELLSNGVHLAANGHAPSTSFKRTEFLLDRNLHKSFPVVTRASGNYLYLMDGRTVFDASSGAAVSCLGHGNKRVINAISAVMNTGISYLASTFWACEIVEQLCKELIDGTDGKMARIYLTGSGQCAKSLHVHVLTSIPRL